MQSLSGMSLILTVALVTLISMECYKNTNTIENYTDLNTDENVENLDQFGQEKSNNKDYIDQKKTEVKSFQDEWVKRVNDSKPTEKQLELIGSDPKGRFPFGNSFIPENEASVPSGSNDRSKDVGLCAQNYNTFGISTLGQPAQGNLASSLLPQSGKDNKGKMKGFEDCDTHNVLAEGFLLTNTAIGQDTTNGSKKDQLYDIRPAPPNPHDFVGIWGMSTKYEGLERKPLEDNTLK